MRSSFGILMMPGCSTGEACPFHLFAVKHEMRELPRRCSRKESACQCRRQKRQRFSSWVEKIPWRRKWQPTPVFFPGKSYGQRSLVGYCPWGRKELDMTEHTHSHTHTHTHTLDEHLQAAYVFVKFRSNSGT